jgi:hypothetical protein
LFQFLKKYAAMPDRWKTVKHVLDDLGLANRPACGLIFVENHGDDINITPYVFVRDIETLYAETACASGSIAAASVLNTNIVAHQPSGKTLQVTLQREGSLVKAEVCGSMRIRWDGPANSLYGDYAAAQRSSTSSHGDKRSLLPVAAIG